MFFEQNKQSCTEGLKHTLKKKRGGGKGTAGVKEGDDL